jgi:hypothetical protein
MLIPGKTLPIKRSCWTLFACWLCLNAAASETITQVYDLQPHPESLVMELKKQDGDPQDPASIKTLMALAYGLALSDACVIQMEETTPFMFTLHLRVTGTREDQAALRWAFFKDGIIPFQAQVEFRRVTFRPEEREALKASKGGAEPAVADWVAAWRSGAGKTTALKECVLTNGVEGEDNSTTNIQKKATILLEGVSIEAKILHQGEGSAMLDLTWKSSGKDAAASETITQLRIVPGQPTLLSSHQSGETAPTEILWVSLLWVDEQGRPFQAPEARK